MNKNNLVPILAIIVVTVWAIVVLASLVTHDTAVVGIVTPVMLIVAGFVFANRSTPK